MMRRRFFRFGSAATAAALGLVLTAHGVTAQYDYHRTTGEIVWRGTQALKLCNGLFVSNRTVDQIYAQEFAGMAEPMPRARVEVESERKTVAIGVPASARAGSSGELRRGLADQPPPRLRRSAEASAKAEAASREGGGTGDPIPAMRAALRPGIGCVALAPDQTFAVVDNLPLLDLPPLTGAISVVWGCSI
jgi:hypothetical protein